MLWDDLYEERVFKESNFDEQGNAHEVHGEQQVPDR